MTTHIKMNTAKLGVAAGLTAGVAAITAGAVALSPVTPMASAPRTVDAEPALLGATSAALKDMSQQELFAEFGVRVGEQFAQAPVVPLVLLAQAAAGDPERLYTQLRQIIDSPLYVADPLIEALADALPEEFGGGSNVTEWRNEEFWGATNAVRTEIAEALGVDPKLDDNYAWKLTQGLLESAERSVSATGLALAGVPSIAEAILTGNNVALYQAVREYTDAPLWAIDPAIEAIAQALPEEFGGGTDGDFTTDTGDGALMKFRNEVLWTATRDTRVAIADALGVEVNDNGDVPKETEESDESEAAPTQEPATTSVKQTWAEKQAEKRAERAEKRAERAEAVRTAVHDARDNVKNAVHDAVNKLKPNHEHTAKSGSESEGGSDSDSGSDSGSED